MSSEFSREVFAKLVNESTTDISLTEILEDESHQVETVVIFVILVVLVITLIFVMAVFIDCRQQKIIESNNKKKSLRRVKRKIQKSLPKLPAIGESAQKEDQQSIVVNMEVEPTSSSSESCVV